MTAEHRNDDKMASDKDGPEASVNDKAWLETLVLPCKELNDFKQDMRWDLSEFKNDVRKTMKDDLTEFKDEVLQELQSQSSSIMEVQTQIVDLELACLKLQDTTDSSETEPKEVG